MVILTEIGNILQVLIRQVAHFQRKVYIQRNILYIFLFTSHFLENCDRELELIPKTPKDAIVYSNCYNFYLDNFLDEDLRMLKDYSKRKVARFFTSKLNIEMI